MPLPHRRGQSLAQLDAEADQNPFFKFRLERLKARTRFQELLEDVLKEAKAS